jgi:hypothetical protein
LLRFRDSGKDLLQCDIGTAMPASDECKSRLTADGPGMEATDSVFGDAARKRAGRGTRSGDDEKVMEMAGCRSNGVDLPG